MSKQVLKIGFLQNFKNLRILKIDGFLKLNEIISTFFVLQWFQKKKKK